MKKLEHFLLISILLLIANIGFSQYRVMVSSDFPPFPVTNSDPDDVQSIVRFLLYSNEFDVEGLIASAGTFGMVAEKKNILAVLDEYEKVDENLRKHDPKYPAADALRAVTYEGKGNNNGISIKWGCGKQPYTDITLKALQPGKYNNITYKPRVINTTDLGADPDDEQSMVRQLVCANEFDIEGLIVATGCWKKNQSNTAMLDKIVNAYEEVFPKLSVHAEDFPTPEYLKSISVMGQTGYGMSDVGTGKDSPGSDLIIASVDKDDPRPVWVMGWGGMNTIAQAIWKVRETRSQAELNKFLSKLRLYDILGQDDAGAWIAKNFPDVFYIRATKVYNWQPPKNGDYQRNDIQSHGPLGAVYPDTKWATEGDTPAFMHVYPNGLNDPDKIDQGSWGGRFSFEKKEGIRSMSEVHKIQEDGETRFDPYFMYGNTPDGGTSIKMWEKAYNNDFAARMDWSVTSNYKDANHHPTAVVNGDKTRQVLKTTASAGSSLELSAAGSTDPDGNTLTYSWTFYKEPSSYDGTVTIQNSSSSSTNVEIPKEARGKTIHVILEIHDNGTPNLYAYRRMIINVN